MKKLIAIVGESDYLTDVIIDHYAKKYNASKVETSAFYHNRSDIVKIDHNIIVDFTFSTLSIGEVRSRIRDLQFMPIYINANQIPREALLNEYKGYFNHDKYIDDMADIYNKNRRVHSYLQQHVYFKEIEARADEKREVILKKRKDASRELAKKKYVLESEERILARKAKFEKDEAIRLAMDVAHYEYLKYGDIGECFDDFSYNDLSFSDLCNTQHIFKM